MADPTLTERARAVIAGLDTIEKTAIEQLCSRDMRSHGAFWRNCGPITAIALYRCGLVNDTCTPTDLGREVTRLLAEAT